MVSKKYCDFCGKEINYLAFADNPSNLVINFDTYLPTTQSMAHRTLDVCPKCGRKILSTIRNRE